MNNDLSLNPVIRQMLFRNAEKLNNRLFERFADLANHLHNSEACAAIGALEGTETDIECIRTLMVLIRDWFPAHHSKEES